MNCKESSIQNSISQKLTRIFDEGAKHKQHANDDPCFYGCKKFKKYTVILIQKNN